MSELTFNPFADDITAATFGGLTVENGIASIVLHGDIVIGRSEGDLAAVRSLAALFARIEAAIVAGAGTDVPAEAARVDEVENPF
jgi:hypothetical protein